LPQALAFALEDVAGSLQLNNTNVCAKTRDLAVQKVASIEQKLSQLQAMRDALAKLVHQCDKNLKSSPCPIIQILALDADSGWAANGSKKRQIPKQKTESHPSGFLKRERYLADESV
jgi:hypothetical protein